MPRQFQGPGIQERVRCYAVAEGFDRYALQDAILRREGSLQAYTEVLMSDFKRVGDTRCGGWQAGRRDGMGCRGGGGGRGRGRGTGRVEPGGAGMSQAGLPLPPGCPLSVAAFLLSLLPPLTAAPAPLPAFPSAAAPALCCTLTLAAWCSGG